MRLETKLLSIAEHGLLTSMCKCRSTNMYVWLSTKPLVSFGRDVSLKDLYFLCLVLEHPRGVHVSGEGSDSLGIEDSRRDFRVKDSRCILPLYSIMHDSSLERLHCGVVPPSTIYNRPSSVNHRPRSLGMDICKARTIKHRTCQGTNGGPSTMNLASNMVVHGRAWQNDRPWTSPTDMKLFIHGRAWQNNSRTGSPDDPDSDARAGA
eukprot:gnl/TRDRNA2_/TRDRNA2_174020_c3_seq1.p1 gnl/TRDRNA2_/TRDRNA2_174020_c3~~gnl/TRDRNA2_/TRDRNA2_174020_c3_seq1.p1  ORF type:complete len:207 (-),score=9.32 gnl/TRDRNA2_/TRDRNA2_174020_c3_seq1:575-1195(-)